MRINKMTILVFVFVFFNTVLVIKNRHYRILLASQSNEIESPLVDLEHAAMRFANTTLEIEELSEIDSLTLCLYVSEYHCQSCVDSSIMQMKSYCLSSGLNFILVSDYSNPRVEHLFNNKNDNGDNIRCINMKNSDYDILSCSYPLIFIYNSSLKIAEHVFVPDVYNAMVTNRFLSLIESKLFTTSN